MHAVAGEYRPASGLLRLVVTMVIVLVVFVLVVFVLVVFVAVVP